MSNMIIGLLAGLGITAWVYSKFMRRTGGNTKNSVISAGIFGLITFFVVWTLAVMIDGYVGN